MKKTLFINQAAIAEASGLSKGLISRIIRGDIKPGRKAIAGLSTALKINPSILLLGTSEQIIEAIRSKMPAPRPDRADPRIDGSGVHHG